MNNAATSSTSAPAHKLCYSQIADLLLDLLPAGRPRRLARMSRPGETKQDGTPRGKYEDISGNLNRSMLVNHARGTVTYSLTIDKDGKAKIGVIDLDHGGRAGLVAGLEAARALGVVAIAVENNSGGNHNGGHIEALFDDFYTATDIQALMRLIADRANLGKVEIWPGSNQGIRALFGFHQLDRTRGNLLLQSGEIISLDSDLAAGVDLVINLPRNGQPPQVERPQVEPQQPTSVPQRAATSATSAASGRRSSNGRIDSRSIAEAVRARFNQEHTWSELLSNAGAVEVQPGYWTCNCGVPHTHNIQIAVTSQDKIVSLSPRCGWARTDKALDKFGFHIDRAHGGNYRAAMEYQARQYGLWVEPQKRATAAQEAPQARTAAQIADAERKRKERAQEAAETLADVRSRMADDTSLTKADRAVLEALLLCAGDRGWCRPSKERLAEMSGCPLGTVKRVLASNGRLEGRYFTSEGDGGAPNSTAIRTFLRGSFLPQAAEQMIHESIDHVITNTESLDLVSGAQPATDETAPLVEQPQVERRELLTKWRALASSASEAGWYLVDWEGRTDAELIADIERLECKAAESSCRTPALSTIPHQEAERNSAPLEAAPETVDTLPAGWHKIKPDFDDSHLPELATFDPSGGAPLVEQPAPAAPKIIELTPLVQAPPQPSDPAYSDFIWRWYASQPGAICKRTGKPYSAKQRDWFKTEYTRLLVDVSPEEAALRWSELNKPKAPKKRKGIGARASQALESVQIGLTSLFASEQRYATG